jgi:hypothetical protein
MEPRTLVTGHAVPFKDQKEKEAQEIDKTQRALSELSLNKGINFSYFAHARF